MPSIPKIAVVDHFVLLPNGDVEERHCTIGPMDDLTDESVQEILGNVNSQMGVETFPFQISWYAEVKCTTALKTEVLFRARLRKAEREKGAEHGTTKH